MPKKIDYEEIKKNRKLNRRAKIKLKHELRIYEKDLVPFNNELEEFIEKWETKPR